MNDDAELYEIIIPHNYNTEKKIGNQFKIRNLIEGSVWLFIIYRHIFNTDFLFKVKIIFLLTIGGSVFLINLIGIKNMSITEFIVAWFKFKKGTNEYHLRSVADERSTKSKVFKSTIGTAHADGTTIAGQWFSQYKQRKEDAAYRNKVIKDHINGPNTGNKVSQAKDHSETNSRFSDGKTYFEKLCDRVKASRSRSKQ